VDPQNFGDSFPAGELQPGERFAVRTSTNDSTVWLAMGGELDVYATPALRAALTNVEQTEPELLVLDLRGLEFLDSSGLAVLLGAHERASASGRSVRLLIKGSRAVETLFETVRAQDFLEIVDDPAELASA
jgi:anti-sigma B factor antagonist